MVHAGLIAEELCLMNINTVLPCSVDVLIGCDCVVSCSSLALNLDG